MSKLNAITHEAIVLKVTDRVTKNIHTTRYLVLENDDEYTKEIAIELYGDKCDLVDNIKSGDNVKVSFNLESRSWNDKYFSSFKFWKVEVVGAAKGSNKPNAEDIEGDKDLDLPF
tara:strand:- start:923 stop:1267 length:345 start_codon:yes stop_codon:yes gene_type:complete